MSIEVTHKNKYWKQGVDYLQFHIDDIYNREFNRVKALPRRIVITDRETFHVIKNTYPDTTVFIKIHEPLRQNHTLLYTEQSINIYANDTPDIFVKKIKPINKEWIAYWMEKCGIAIYGERVK